MHPESSESFQGLGPLCLGRHDLAMLYSETVEQTASPSEKSQAVTLCLSQKKAQFHTLSNSATMLLTMKSFDTAARGPAFH